MSRDPPSFFLSFPSRELRLSPPQMSVSLRLGSILRSVPLLRRPTMPLPCYQLRVYLSFFFLFPFFSPFLVHLSPYSLFGSSSFLPPSCAVSPIADFPPLPPSYLAVFFQLKTTVHTLSVAFCLAQSLLPTSTYFLSFLFSIFRIHLFFTKIPLIVLKKFFFVHLFIHRSILYSLPSLFARYKLTFRLS